MRLLLGKRTDPGLGTARRLRYRLRPWLRLRLRGGPDLRLLSCIRLRSHLGLGTSLGLLTGPDLWIALRGSNSGLRLLSCLLLAAGLNTLLRGTPGVLDRIGGPLNSAVRRDGSRSGHCCWLAMILVEELAAILRGLALYLHLG